MPSAPFIAPILRITILTAALLLPQWAFPGQTSWTGIARVVAIGDLHGDYAQYQKLLTLNELVDNRMRWRGGRTHLVQLGDVPDRGPDSLRILHHLMRLQREASRAGGAVHTLVGNHEAMNVLGELGYVHPGEYSALVTRNSIGLQKDYLKKVMAQRIREEPALADDRKGLMAKLAVLYPPGYVEHRLLWQPGGELARWVAGNPAVIRINRTLFCHGGINPQAQLLSIDSINADIAATLRGAPTTPQSLATREDGPLWYRGLAQENESIDSAAVDRMLAFYDVDRIVIAHTPSAGRIVTRHAGKVIVVDTGISAHYGGHAVNLLIDGDTLYIQHPTGREPLRSETP